MTNKNKDLLKWALLGGAAFCGYKWYVSKEEAAAQEALGALALQASANRSVRKGQIPTAHRIPAGIPQLAGFQTQEGPQGACGVSSPLGTPHYMGCGSTF